MKKQQRVGMGEDSRDREAFASVRLPQTPPLQILWVKLQSCMQPFCYLNASCFGRDLRLKLPFFSRIKEGEIDALYARKCPTAYPLWGDMGLPTHCLASSAAPHLTVGAAEQVACFPGTIYSLTQPPVRQSWLVNV